MVVYQYSCPVHGIVATSSIRRGAQRAIRCPACGADTETWIGPKIGLRTTEEPSPEEVYQYWEGTGWVNEVLVDGREVVDPSAVSGTPVRRASGPILPGSVGESCAVGIDTPLPSWSSSRCCSLAYRSSIEPPPQVREAEELPPVPPPRA